jgi:protein-disulfide isomerase-like protein with CxxC motif
VHENGDLAVADSAVVARTVISAANTEKQRGATMLLRVEQDKYEGMRGIEARAREVVIQGRRGVEVRVRVMLIGVPSCDVYGRSSHDDPE